MVPGRAAEGIKLVGQEGFASSVILLEGLAQIAGLAVGVGHDGGFLAALDKLEIRGPLQPGDSVVFKGLVRKAFGSLHLVEGLAEVDGAVLASGLLTVGVGRL